VKILNIGGAGYLGDSVTDALIMAGHEVHVYDNLLYQDYFLKNVHFIYGDIRDQAKLAAILPKYDCVILLAGIVGDHACQIFTDKTIEINTTAPKWIIDNFDKKIVYMSTCSVFGKNDNLLNEDSQVNPLSLYASSKLETERYLFKKRKDALSFRLGTVYGKSGDHSRPRLDLVGNILTAKAALGQTLTVFGREQNRPLINCLNVAEAVSFGIDKDISGLYVLSEKNFTLGEIAEEIVKLIPGSEISYNDIMVSDMRNYKVDASKIYNLGWTPKHTFSDGILSIKALVNEGRIKDINDSLYHNGKYIQSLKDL